MFSSDKTQLDLDCGISYTRIASWLDDELSLPRKNGWWTYALAAQTCRIALEPLENRTLGNVSLERTRMIARGDREALSAFEKLFTLRFISAGG